MDAMRSLPQGIHKRRFVMLMIYLLRGGVRMPRTSALGKIEKEVERLSPQEQLKLMEKIAHHLRKTGISVKKELDWTGLYGLGKGLWKGEDAQEYVNRLREDRV